MFSLNPHLDLLKYYKVTLHITHKHITLPQHGKVMCLIQKTDLILNWSSNVHQIINKNWIRRQEIFAVHILYHATYTYIHLLKLYF